MPLVQDDTTIEDPKTGDELDLGQITFISRRGPQLTVYLPETLDRFKGPNGEPRARQIGGQTIEFEAHQYPLGSQSVPREVAKLMLADDRRGDVYHLAASEIDVEPTTGSDLEREPEPESDDGAEETVEINGEEVPKSEALEMLGVDASALEEGPESQPSPEDEEPVQTRVEPEPDELVVLDGPNNKQEAIEALASEGVDLAQDGAPTPSDSAKEIQRFAVNHGFVIDKYDLPDTL